MSFICCVTLTVTGTLLRTLIWVFTERVFALRLRHPVFAQNPFNSQNCSKYRNCSK